MALATPHWYGKRVAQRSGDDSALEVQGDLLLTGPGRPRGLNRLPERYELRWIAGQRGKPGVNADINSATEATREVTDPDFEVLGSGGSSDDVTFHAEGGIQLQTDGGGTDSVIVAPHLDTNQSAWSQVTWGTDKEAHWEADLSTAASVADVVLWAGLKLTNTDVVATDANQAFFRYEDSGNWIAVSSAAGVDSEMDTGIAVEASTRYHLAVRFDALRIARFYINGRLVATSPTALTAVDLIPYIGILEGAAAAKTLYVHGQAISRVIG